MLVLIDASCWRGVLWMINYILRLQVKKMHFTTVELDLLVEEVWQEVKKAFKYSQIKAVGGCWMKRCQLGDSATLLTPLAT